MSSVVVITTTSVNDRIKGTLSRWTVEVKPGVFVGRLSAKVRNELWNTVRGHVGTGSATAVWQTSSDQGFTVESHGDNRRTLIDHDGIVLPATKEYNNYINTRSF